MHRYVSLQVCRLRKGFSAIFALEGFLSGMHTLVRLQGWGFNEGLSTFFTWIWFLSCVNVWWLFKLHDLAKDFSQCSQEYGFSPVCTCLFFSRYAFLAKGFPALLTCIGFLRWMNKAKLVDVQVWRGWKWFPTMVTCERTFLCFNKLRRCHCWMINWYLIVPTISQLSHEHCFTVHISAGEKFQWRTVQCLQL